MFIQKNILRTSKFLYKAPFTLHQKEYIFPEKHHAYSEQYTKEVQIPL